MSFDFIYRHTIEHINFSTLAILFCLMAVVEGFQKLGYIDLVAGFVTKKAKSIKLLTMYLCISCFILSMFVTNDVALIIIVPFTINIINKLKISKGKIIEIIVLETIAANMGSMATPVGNPQNLYLYGEYNMNLLSFYKTIGIYSVVAFCLLIIIINLISKKDNVSNNSAIEARDVIFDRLIIFKTIIYLLLFIISVLSVLGVIKYYIAFVIVVISVLILDKDIIKKINFGLLFKFIVLFLIVGNIADISFISKALSSLVKGNEFVLGIVLSQFVSNVPAAIMLSEFTTNGYELMLAVDIGGLGTLIASMASVISMDFYMKCDDANKKEYIIKFTLYNILFLVVMILVKMIGYIVNL